MDDDSSDDPPRRRRRKSDDGGSEPREHRSRRKKESDRSSASPPRSKKKKKKKKKDGGRSGEDALEAKMRAKSKRKQKPTTTAAEDALEAKIRRKERKKAAVEKAEEEKVEEVASDDSYGDDGHDEEWGDWERDAKKKPKGHAKSAHGGGDIRDRAPQQPGAAALQKQAADPLRAAELAREEKKKNAKDVNPRFAQLHETGQWGGLNKWEKYGICLLVVAAMVTAIVLGVQFGTGGPETDPPTRRPSVAPTGAPSATPTLAPTADTYRETHGLTILLAASPKLSLPETPGELKGAKARPGATPQELAGEFVLYDDPLALPARDPRFVERYALATLYYQNGGCAGAWAAGADAGWLGGADHCGTWRGIACDLQLRVTELNLARTHVTGQLPVELGQMAELSTLDLSNNLMTGTVPAQALRMSKMYTISLSNNDFEGEFPFDEVKQGAEILDNLWIQENQKLTGTITAEYCLMGSVTLDCINMYPRPVYSPNPDLTTFQQSCINDVGRGPGEYTCNSDFPEPLTKSPTEAVAGPVPAAAPPAICGVPAPA